MENKKNIEMTENKNNVIEMKEKKPNVFKRGLTKVGNAFREAKEHPAAALVGAGLTTIGAGIALSVKMFLKARGADIEIENEDIPELEAPEETYEDFENEEDIGD